MKLFVVTIIKFYQKYISSLRKPCCRFVPNCSDYALECIERFGVLRGGFMTLWRILRCNPFCKGGYDPVPEKNKKKNKCL